MMVTDQDRNEASITDQDRDEASNSGSCSSGPTQALPSTGVMDAVMMVTDQDRNEASNTDQDRDEASNSGSCSSGPTQALPSTCALDAAMMVTDQDRNEASITDQDRDEASNSGSCSSGPTQAVPSTGAMDPAMMVTDQDRDEVRRLLTLYGSLKLTKRIDDTSIATTTTTTTSRTNTSATRPVVHYTKERKTVGLSSQQITRLGYSQHTGKWRGFPYDSWSCCNSSGAKCVAGMKLMAEEKVHSLLVRELPVESQQTAYRGTMLAVREQLSITGDVVRRRRQETMSASRRSLSKNINSTKKNASLRRYEKRSSAAQSPSNRALRVNHHGRCSSPNYKKASGDTGGVHEKYNSGRYRQAWLPTSPTRCTSFHRSSSAGSSKLSSTLAFYMECDRFK
jgi:hypothetical protein